MSVQARIAFFEALKTSASSSASGAALTADADATVCLLVDLHEAIATPLPADSLLTTAHTFKHRAPTAPTPTASSLHDDNREDTDEDADVGPAAATDAYPEGDLVRHDDPASHRADAAVGAQAQAQAQADAVSDAVAADAVVEETAKSTERVRQACHGDRQHLSYGYRHQQQPRTAASTRSAPAITTTSGDGAPRSLLPSRLRPTRVVVRASAATDARAQSKQQPREPQPQEEDSVLRAMRCRVQTAGCRLLEFRRSAKYLQRVADSKQRRAAARATLDARRPFAAP